MLNPIHAVGISCDGATVLQHATDGVDAVPECTVPALDSPFQLMGPKYQLSLGALGRLRRVQISDHVVAEKENLFQRHWIEWR